MCARFANTGTHTHTLSDKKPGEEVRAHHRETLPTVIINYVLLPLLPVCVCVTTYFFIYILPSSSVHSQSPLSLPLCRHVSLSIPLSAALHLCVTVLVH